MRSSLQEPIGKQNLPARAHDEIPRASRGTMFQRIDLVLTSISNVRFREAKPTQEPLSGPGTGMFTDIMRRCAHLKVD